MPRLYVPVINCAHDLASRSFAQPRMAVPHGKHLFRIQPKVTSWFPNPRLSLDGARFDYEDALCEFPERLVAEWLGHAIRVCAEVRNHTDALQVEIFGGQVRGIRLRDAFTGQESAVACDTVINATGPWVDRFCALA